MSYQMGDSLPSDPICYTGHGFWLHFYGNVDEDTRYQAGAVCRYGCGTVQTQKDVDQRLCNEAAAQKARSH